MQPRRHPILLASALIATAAVLVIAAPLEGQAQEADPAVPKRHFRVDRPASLTDADAMTIYDQILDDIVAGYRLSEIPASDRYRTWRRYNKAPYRSATHGERFVNNYANATAEAYGRFEEAGTLPVGSILAKDSFAATARGDVYTGPLFLMEKMPTGFRPDSRDWRYSMIMPDGSLFGTTNGPGSDRVGFCITCHRTAGGDSDDLYFVPPSYRLNLLKTQ